MTNHAIAVREPNQLTNDQLAYIANTEFVPKGLRGNKPAIMACVITGRALGLDDMSSLRLIHVVNGRPTFSAELMVQIVRKHGHSISGQTKDGSCTVVGKRADNGDTMEVTWTLEMAKRAGLADKATWKAYPEALLWARAVSQLCRQLFADCFAGASGTYTEEELSGGTVDAEFAEAPALELEASAGEPQAEGRFQSAEASVSQTATDESASPADDLASEPQRRLIFARAKEAGVDQAALKQIVLDITGQDSSKLIPAGAVDAVLLAVEAAAAA